jgi:hypothetical protein
MNTNPKSHHCPSDFLVEAYLARLAGDPGRAQTIGVMPVILVENTLPHTDPKTHIFERVNGLSTLTMSTSALAGLPFGIYPRLMLAWMCTRASRTKSPIINLTYSPTDFLSGTLKLTKGRANKLVIDQVERLFSLNLKARFVHEKKQIKAKNIPISDDYSIDLFAKSSTDWCSEVTLSANFLDECLNRVVPIDLDVYAALRGSPLAMDVYVWLTYRMATLKSPSHPIPWKILMLQFGGNYAPSSTKKFRYRFLLAIRLVNFIYPVKTEATKAGLILFPGATHIPSNA